MNYLDCLNEIESFQNRGVHRGLDRMKRALNLLNQPQDRFPTIHIAGTNGKGSTAAMTAEILKRSHYKVGLTISPHIEDLRERIQVNGNWISQDEFVHLHLYLKKRLDFIKPTYFEWIILMAFLYFAESRVDIAVLETGLGGRWDATNVVSPLVGAITNVSYDHQEFLGNELPQILAEKLEIFKPGMVAWTSLEDPSLLVVMEQYCRTRDIPLYKIKNYFKSVDLESFSIFDYRRLSCGLKGEHQKKNAALAVALVYSLIQKGYSIRPGAIVDGLLKVKWPGRLELIFQKPKILLDGAHNLAGIQTLVAYLKSQGKKYHLVFGAVNDKPFKDMAILLAPFAKSFCWASFESPRSYSVEETKKIVDGLNASLLKETFMQVDQKNWKNYCSMISPDDTILVCGSLYLVSQIRSFIFKKGFGSDA